jgi:putative MFS transporter
MTSEHSPSVLPQTQEAVGLPRIILLCAAGGFLDGYDLLIMGAALLLIVPEFHLTSAQTGMLASVPFISMALGALIAGRLCDRFGRRAVYLVDIMLFLVFALFQAASQELWQLFVARFFIGFAIGVDMPTGSSMLAEFSPPKLRGALTSLLNTAWLCGGFVAMVVGYVMHETLGPSAWRWMFAAAAVPAVLIAVMRHGLPETTFYLRQKASPESARPGGFAQLLDKRWRGPVAFFTIYWLLESFAAGPAFIYTALIFKQVAQFEGASALLLSACLMAVYVVVSLVLQFTLLDRWGRKPFAATACLIAGVGAIATAWLAGGGVPLVVAFSIFCVAANVSVLPFWPWSVEQLPTHLRATGQAVGSAGGKIGVFLGVLLFSPGTIEALGWTVYFLIVGSIFLALVAIVLLWGRETKGLVLED